VSGFRELPLRHAYYPQDRPLDAFYVPALSRAASYDRIAGYFRSTALAAAAVGISRFIAGGGTMRMIVGAELDPQDVRAIIEGDELESVVARRLAEEPLEAADTIAEHRLAALAWLVREGRLEIKVGVPTDKLGHPLRADQARAYFHAKLGVLVDPEGDSLAFSGSVNESAAAWRHNLEQLQVYASWDEAIWKGYGEDIVRRFAAYWDGAADDGWAIVDLPEAARADLIKRAPPASGPSPRSADLAEQAEVEESREDRDRALLRFARDAPRIGGGTGVGYATAGVEPFPHQIAIARRAVETFPRGYLLADEVGLGKTIEAGLILRELLLTGRAESALLLVPASVVRQWQQELSEKLALDVPHFDGSRFFGVTGDELEWARGTNPWQAFPVVLASSHLARRRSRRAELLSAGRWDVVLVDEAHHARRRGKTEEPNTLLRLLREMRAAHSWEALYLASATPMQMNAHEAWDLLDLLGLPGKWGESADAFVAYYSELRGDFDERDWELISQMSRDYRTDVAARTDDALEAAAKDRLGLAGSRPIRQIGAEGISEPAARALSPEARTILDAWLRAHTPMRDRVFRTTRAALRQYKAAGLMAADVNIPVREIDDRFVPLTALEQDLYERIETYISRFYDAYREAAGEKRRALGFIMTVYRRRLTSSFRAVELSLQRRLAVLEGGADLGQLLDDDDLAAIEGSVDEEMGDIEGPAHELAEEMAELRSFLQELETRPPNESKMEYLLGELEAAFAGPHDTVIIFTQYTDTMDYIREQLVTQFGSGVGCYSGRGGELWDSDTQVWQRTAKEQIKALFRDGELKILIGTDSLSEGLNLQTCGRLINYDMPWNFMRVEQRIGRIDRIGGRPRVHVSNYFYADTVEEQIYRGIAEDFEWFEDVVGPAQPVLNQIESAIEDVAMQEPGEDRQRELAERVAQIRSQIDEGKRRPVTLEDMESTDLPDPVLEPAIDLAGLEQVLSSISVTSACLEPHPQIGGAYLLTAGTFEAAAVTLRPTVLDQHSPAVRLLSYLTPELEALISSGTAELGGDAALHAAHVQALETFAEVNDILAAEPPGTSMA
jgi:superfamily II DNA or RNA helicase